MQHAWGKKKKKHKGKALESESLGLNPGSTANQSVDLVPLSPLGKVQTMSLSYSWVEVMIKYVQFSSVTQSCQTLCNPMVCSMPGFPVHPQLPESTQTHVHWVGDAIQPSHPLSSPSPPAFNLSQHEDLFKWISSSHQVAKVLEFQLPSNEYSGLISFRMDWLDLLPVQEIFMNQIIMMVWSLT